MFKTTLTLLMSLYLLTGCDSSTSEEVTVSVDDTLLGLSNYIKVPLDNDQMYSLAYMWHEEKLAYDIYLELDKAVASPAHKNIANMSEIVHMQYVEELVEWYDINISNLADYTVEYSKEELETMPTGIFAVPEIQTLYDTLYAEGNVSLQASLEVGCKVEVVDVNDLDHFISISTGNAALIDSFDFLREGSYKHYWKFHNTLIDEGVTEGCCSLGAEFCKTDVYPQQ
ncbi:MAG: DUF2202 domain-containing protein [Campylobacterota bacterium]